MIHLGFYGFWQTDCHLHLSCIYTIRSRVGVLAIRSVARDTLRYFVALHCGRRQHSNCVLFSIGQLCAGVGLAREETNLLELVCLPFARSSPTSNFLISGVNKSWTFYGLS